jgi:hypothetical protein
LIRAEAVGQQEGQGYRPPVPIDEQIRATVLEEQLTAPAAGQERTRVRTHTCQSDQAAAVARPTRAHEITE